jgi:hypothetical protein
MCRNWGKHKTPLTARSALHFLAEIHPPKNKNHLSVTQPSIPAPYIAELSSAADECGLIQIQNPFSGISGITSTSTKLFISKCCNLSCSSQVFSKSLTIKNLTEHFLRNNFVFEYTFHTPASGKLYVP